MFLHVNIWMCIFSHCGGKNQLYKPHYGDLFSWRQKAGFHPAPGSSQARSEREAEREAVYVPRV